MNPELLRNIWVELTERRLLLTGLVIAALLAGGCAHGPAPRSKDPVAMTTSAAAAAPPPMGTDPFASRAAAAALPDPRDPERITHSLRDLWHLRAELYHVLALNRDQREAEQRLTQLNRHFPTRAPRSGFVPLLS